MLRPTLLAGCFVLLLGASVSAERTSTQITRENVGDHPFAFEIAVTDKFHEGRELRFEVVVKPKREPRSADAELGASLNMHKGDTLISTCQVQGKETDRGLVYSFLVNRKYLKDSNFVFGESFGEAGGAYYWFTLKDFE